MRTSTFALAFGLFSLALGIAGLIPAALVPPPPEAPALHFTLLYGYLLGLFPVNLLHTAARIAFGAWGIAAWRGRADPGGYARATAIFYGTLAVIGLLSGSSTLFGVMPVNGNDVWLHAISAALAAYFGWRELVEARSLAHAERRRRAVFDRRQQVAFVAFDRRRGVGDRRIPHNAQLGF